MVSDAVASPRRRTAALPLLVAAAALGGAAWAFWPQLADNAALLALWMPVLLLGFLQNILIGAVAIAAGTAAGLLVGALQISPVRPLRWPARAFVLFFRNSPWLVFIYFMTYILPFEIVLGRSYLPFPDWLKATVGLALPASANVAEIFRGAIMSIPSAQWDAASCLSFSRAQIFRLIILPQCLRRMLPPWMNLYAIITKGTVLASLVGVTEVLTTAQRAANSVHRTDFTLLVYLTVFLLFFLYCYPIARLTRRLERRHAGR